MKRIEKASLHEAIQIVLDPKVFPDEGEFQTLFGFHKDEVRKIGAIGKRADVELAFNPEQIRKMFVGMLIGYPHYCIDHIAKHYGFDVREID